MYYSTIYICSNLFKWHLAKKIIEKLKTPGINENNVIIHTLYIGPG